MSTAPPDAFSNKHVETDRLLRRIGRTAIIVCVAMAAVAFALSGSPLRSACAVLGGGLIASVSYLAIQSGVSAFVDRLIVSEALPRRPALRWAVTKLTVRYALLGFGAYVMIARLRLPPLGLLAGASSIVAAVAVEAVRLLIMKDPSPRT
jgi:hypothetical protein